MSLKLLDDLISSNLVYVDDLKNSFKIADKYVGEAMEKFPDPLVFYQKNPTLEHLNQFFRYINSPEISEKDLLGKPELFIKMEKEILRLENDKEYFKAFDRLKFHLQGRASYLTLYSIIKFDEPISQLIQEALEGNDDKLFKAVHVEKALIVSPLIREKIHRATLSGNQFFLSSVGESLSEPIDVNSHSEIRLFNFLSGMWALRFYTLTDPELCFLIERHDIYPRSNPEQLRTFRNRHGFKKDRKTINSIFPQLT